MMAHKEVKTIDRTRPPRPGPMGKVSFPKHYEKEYTNGFKLLVVENHALPLVTIAYVVRAGSSYDAGLPGLAGVMSELLTKGTRKRSATQIAEEIDFIGGSLSTSASWDRSQLHVTVLRNHLATGFDILQDLVLNSTFPDEEINRVKAQRLAGIRQMKADPGYLADTRFARTVFGDHPYGNPSGGTEKSLTEMKRNDLVGYHKRFFSPDNSFIAFAGDISLPEAEKLVSRTFAKWKGKIKNVPIAPPDPYKENGVVRIVDKPGAVQSSVRIGHVGLARKNPDFLKVMVMNTLLGGYFSSRINMNLREVHGYTYGGRSTFDARVHPGVFEISADVRNEVTGETVDEVIKELDRICKTLPSRDEMTMVKNYLIGLFPIQLETPQQVAGRVADMVFFDLPRNYYKNYRENVAKITARDIRAVARKYIRPENLAIVLSGNSKEIAEKLRRFGRVEVFDAEGNSVSES